MFMRFNIKKVALWLTITMLIAFGVAGTIFAAGKSGLPISWDNGFSINSDGSKNSQGSSNINQNTSNKIDGLKEIDVSSVSAVINIIPSDTQEVKAHLYGTASTTPKLTAETTGNRLQIKTEYPVSIGVHLNPSSLTLDIEIPKAYSGDFTCESVSGPVNISDFNFENMTLRTTSGNIKAKNIAAKSTTVTSTSGKTDLQSLKGGLSFKSTSGALNAVLADNSDKTDINTTSGKIVISGLSSDFSFSSVSGSLAADFEEVNGNVKLHSTSGDLHLKMPESSNFSLDFKTTSSSFSNSFPMTTNSNDKHRVTGIVNKGSHSIQADTVSGSMELIKK